MTPLERWQRRIDAIVEYFVPELALARAKARRALAAAARAAPQGQPAGWKPMPRPIEGGTRVADALESLRAPGTPAGRRPWLRHRLK